MNALLQRITLEADTLIFLFALAMATVLAALAGLAVVWVCRHRAAPLRCALATVALVLVAAAPLLTLSTDRMRIGLLRMPIERQADVRASAAQKVDAMFVAPVAKASNSPGNSSDATIVVGEAHWNSFAEDEAILQADETTPAHAALTPVAPSVWRMFGSALVAVWAIGVLVAAAALLRGLIAVSRLRRTLRPATDRRLRMAAGESAARLGMRAAPPLFVSSTATVPFSLGMWRPSIVFPNDAARQLSDDQLQAVLLHDLVFVKGEANGLNIDDGGSYDSPSHHVVLKNLTLRDIGSDRNHDAIKLSGLDDFRIEGCTVERWGQRGSAIDMVGCHRGLVVDCTFREGDKIYASGVQIKGGSSQVTVRRCRFENAGGRAINLGGNTGASYFRPKTVRYEAKDLVVEDCTFIGSMAPVAFVGVDGAIVRNNTFYRPTRWVMRILQENQGEKIVACRDGKFTNNIVVFRSDELAYPVNFGPKTEPKSFQFADNFWFCIDRPEKTRRVVRLPTAERGGVYGSNPRFRDADQGDLRVATDGPAKGFGPQEKRNK